MRAATRGAATGNLYIREYLGGFFPVYYRPTTWQDGCMRRGELGDMLFFGCCCCSVGLVVTLMSFKDTTAQPTETWYRMRFDCGALGVFDVESRNLAEPATHSLGLFSTGETAAGFYEVSVAGAMQRLPVSQCAVTMTTFSKRPIR